MLTKAFLTGEYAKGNSMQDIAEKVGCSLHKVAYWMEKHKIPRRTMSDAIYLKHNPNGDPFKFRPPRTQDTMFLFGLGLGLYWGEGTKANKTAIRLGNTDPELIAKFMTFMMKLFGVKREDFRFGLQIFTDMNTEAALQYWIKRLKVKRTQFSKVIVTVSGSIGTYRKKSKYGVVTLHYNNTKLRKLFDTFLPP